MEIENVDIGVTLLVALLFAFVMVALFRVMRSRLRRQSARYALHRVRVELTSHVAKGTLTEDHKVFKYYYKRISSSLESIQSFGFDNALVTYIEYKDKVDFDRKLMQERLSSAKILRLVVQLDSSVAETITCFYSANRQMLLAHSSTIRILYTLTSRQLVPFLQLKLKGVVGWVIGDRLRMAAEFLLFADREVSEFRELVAAPRKGPKY